MSPITICIFWIAIRKMTALKKAREYVIEQAKLLVRQKATIDDVAIAVDRLEVLENSDTEQSSGVPFKVVTGNGVPVTKCVVEFSDGIKIVVWISYGWTTRAIDAAKLEYKKLYKRKAPSIEDIEKPEQHMADKKDFDALTIKVPYTANDGTPEQLTYIAG